MHQRHIEPGLAHIPEHLLEQFKLLAHMGLVGPICSGKMGEHALEGNPGQLLQGTEEIQNFTRHEPIASHAAIHLDMHRQGNTGRTGVGR